MFTAKKVEFQIRGRKGARRVVNMRVGDLVQHEAIHVLESRPQLFSRLTSRNDSVGQD